MVLSKDHACQRISQPEKTLHQGTKPADPIAALIAAEKPGVLAMITGVDGPSYRPLGARMAVLWDGQRIGTLSSGCIENDIALHAAEALAKNTPRTIRYGTGSPYPDITLPCGGGLEITLIPAPDLEVLQAAHEAAENRQHFRAALEVGSGRLRILGQNDASRDFTFSITPDPAFYIFGKGPEASTFAALAASTGYPHLLISPDDETLEIARRAGSQTRHITSAKMPEDLTPDRWSAVVLFFHDHEWEPPILAQALETEAFYIGAQGSQRAAATRRSALVSAGVSESKLNRLRGPIGLVASARDARTLSVSVLAEVLAADPDRNNR